MESKLYAIGYRGLSHKRFFALLEEANVSILLDVRRNPYSPNPDYQKESLVAAVGPTKVRYFHVPQLGVPGAGRSPIEPGEPTTFEEQLATASTQKALQKILSILVNGHSVALMCSEPDYLTCHRRRIVEELKRLSPTLAFGELTGKGEQRLF